jgi:anaerobic dimethyl sulfoxide reductase subunit A
MTALPTFCGKDCGGNACPLLAHVEDGRVVKVTDNPAAGPYLKGCRRGFDLPREASAPQRITKPLIRDGERGSGRFREAGWDEALQLAADGLADVRARFGAGAVLNLASAGSTSALHGTGGLLGRFLALFGGSTNLTGSYSCGAADFALPYMLGEDYRSSGFDPATMQHSRMIVLWGANVLEARLGTEIDQRLLEARRRGTPIVVIDPRRSATARRTGAWWIPLKPGTDAALMLAVMHVLVSEGFVDRGFVDSHCVGFDALEKYVLGEDGGTPCTPAWAQAICGTPADEILRFARSYAAAKPAMLLPGFSIQRVQGGEEPFRLAVALQVATANSGVRGGSTGSLNARLPSPRVGRLPVPALPILHSVPVLRWPDAVLEGRAGGYPSDIRAIYSVGGNLLNQGGNIRRGRAAFLKADLAVCHEMFLTPTARHSDVILPVAHALEKTDIGIPWVGNFLAYRRQAAPPPGLCRTDYDILCDLAERLGFGRAFSEGRSASAWLQRLLDESEVPDHEEFRRTGLYLAPDQERVGLAEFAADPARRPLRTPSGKVEIASARYREETGFPEIPQWREPSRDPRFPLLLLTPKSPHRTHSQGSGVAAISRRAAHALEMHPRDAEARGLADGERVRAFNERGEVHVQLRLTTDLSPGVTCLPEGQWVELDSEGRDLAGSANMLTDTEGTLPSVSCVMHGIGIEVERSRLQAGGNR